MTESLPDRSASGQASSAERSEAAGDGGWQVSAPPVDARLGWGALGLSTVSTLVYLATSHALWTWVEFLTSAVRKVLGVFQ
jgi:hypothetical protein